MSEGRLHPVKGYQKNVKPKGPPQLLFHPAEVRDEVHRADELHNLRPGLISREKQKEDAYWSKSDRDSRPTQREVKESIATSSKKAKLSIDDRYGELCGKAVELFITGATQLDVIRELKVGFDVAEHFWNAYMRAQPGWFLPSKDFIRLRGILDWKEDRPTVEGFNRALNRFMHKEAAGVASPVSSREEAAIEAALKEVVTEDSDDDEETGGPNGLAF